MGIVATTDRAAGGLARAATTLGQLALVALGVHRAGDHLDDLVAQGLDAVWVWSDAHLAGPSAALAAAVGMPEDSLWLWQGVSAPALGAVGALGVELAAVLILWASFLFSARDARPTWAGWRKVLGLHALVLPWTLAGVLAAGSWSLAMAVEDLLPSSNVGPWAAAAVGLAAGLRFGLPAWKRATAELAPTAPAPAILQAAVLVPIAVLTWRHGLPIWGWLP